MDGEATPAGGADPASVVRRRDRERWLSILWAPARARAAMAAIHAYDLELQRIVADAGETLLAEIRLAWWREQIDAVVRGSVPPAQPLIRLLATSVREAGVDLGHLSRMEEGFLPLLLAGDLDAAQTAAARGEPLFEALAEAEAGGVLDAGTRVAVRAAGAIWGIGALLRGPWGRRASIVTAAALPQAPPPPPLDGVPPSLAGLAILAWTDWRRAQDGRPLPPRATMGRQWRFLRVALAHRGRQKP